MIKEILMVKYFTSITVLVINICKVMAKKCSQIRFWRICVYYNFKNYTQKFPKI